MKSTPGTEQIRRISVAVLGLYLLFGMLNTGFGGYDPHYSSDGRRRYKFGPLMHDCIIWQPRLGTYYNEFRHDMLGLLFFPFISLMQHHFRPTHSVFDTDFQEWWSKVTVKDVHPDYRADFLRWQTEES